MRPRKPRCYLVYALAPEGTTPPEANRLINAYIADESLPLVIFHDHFIGQLGGIAIFFVEDATERDTLYASTEKLPGWEVQIQPLIYAYSPAALDAQISYTMRAYRDADWAALRNEQRPAYGNPNREAETGEEA